MDRRGIAKETSGALPSHRVEAPDADDTISHAVLYSYPPLKGAITLLPDGNACIEYKCAKVFVDRHNLYTKRKVDNGIMVDFEAVPTTLSGFTHEATCVWAGKRPTLAEVASSGPPKRVGLLPNEEDRVFHGFVSKLYLPDVALVVIPMESTNVRVHVSDVVGEPIYKAGATDGFISNYLRLKDRVQFKLRSYIGSVVFGCDVRLVSPKYVVLPSRGVENIPRAGMPKLSSFEYGVTNSEATKSEETVKKQPPWKSVIFGKSEAAGSHGRNFPAAVSYGRISPAAGTSSSNLPAAGSHGVSFPAAGSHGKNFPAAGPSGRNLSAAGPSNRNLSAAGSSVRNFPASGSSGRNFPAAGGHGRNFPAAVTSSRNLSAAGSTGKTFPATGSSGRNFPAAGTSGRNFPAAGTSGRNFPAAGFARNAKEKPQGKTTGKFGKPNSAGLSMTFRHREILCGKATHPQIAGAEKINAQNIPANSPAASKAEKRRKARKAARKRTRKAAKKVAENVEANGKGKLAPKGVKKPTSKTVQFRPIPVLSPKTIFKNIYHKRVASDRIYRKKVRRMLAAKRKVVSSPGSTDIGFNWKLKFRSRNGKAKRVFLKRKINEGFRRLERLGTETRVPQAESLPGPKRTRRPVLFGEFLENVTNSTGTVRLTVPILTIADLTAHIKILPKAKKAKPQPVNKSQNNNSEKAKKSEAKKQKPKAKKPKSKAKKQKSKTEKPKSTA